MKHSAEQRSAPLNILTGATLISFSGVWVVWSGVNPTVSAFYRVFFGSLFLLFACVIRQEIAKLQFRTLALIMLCGLFFAADLYCWHASIAYIGPGLATILANFQVFILAAVSIFVFGEKVKHRFFYSIPFAFLGLILIVGVRWSTLPENYQNGIYLGLATAICYTAFLLILRRIQMIETGISFFYRLMLVSLATAFFLALQIIFSAASFSIPNFQALASLLGLALFSQTIGWSFIANSLPRVIPAIAGLILLLQPALAFVWDVMLFDRPTSYLNWLGAGCALGAIYMGMSASPEDK